MSLTLVSHCPCAITMNGDSSSLFIFLTDHPTQGCGWAEAYPGCHMVSGGVHLGQTTRTPPPNFSYQAENMLFNWLKSAILTWEAMGIDLLLEPPLRGRTSLERNCSFFLFHVAFIFQSWRLPGGWILKSFFKWSTMNTNTNNYVAF